jgi:hypothetical protein
VLFSTTYLLTNIFCYYAFDTPKTFLKLGSRFLKLQKHSFCGDSLEVNVLVKEFKNAVTALWKFCNLIIYPKYFGGWGRGTATYQVQPAAICTKLKKAFGFIESNMQ